MASAAKVLSQLLHTTIPYLLLNEEAIESFSYHMQAELFSILTALKSGVTDLVKILP